MTNDYVLSLKLRLPPLDSCLVTSLIMKHPSNLQSLQDSINKGTPVLVYFSGEDCSVCQVLKPKVEAAVLDNYPKFKLFEVKTETNKPLASHFMVFTIPTILIFFDSKEFIRVGRNISITQLIQELKRLLMD